MHRRSFLKRLAGGVVAAALAPLAHAAAATRRRPNVLVILADDLGAVDLNCYGSSDLETPNLDALASRGTRFTQFYVGAPVCSPSRAALLTGRCPQRAGVPGNVGAKGMPTEQVTLAEVMKEAGYATACFGKWHLGAEEGCRPRDQGFNEFFGHLVGCIDNYSHFFYWSGPNRHDLWHNETETWENGTFFSDIIVREATRFLKAHRDDPFFLYLPFNAPHYPYQGTEKWRPRYKDLPYPRNHYAPFVSTLDEKIGQVLATLRTLGLEDNTLVVFFSDNGHSEEVRAMNGGGSAGPYRGCKFTLWEGGLRLPCIISWPKGLPRGEVRGQFTASVDLFPTIADLCGIPMPDRPIDGHSLVPILKSPDAPDAHAEFHWESGGQKASRQGSWKLVQNARGAKGGDKTFLANLADDVGEQTNLAAKHPEKVKDLKALHAAWKKDVQENR